LLRGLPHHASRGRIYLPADLLAAHGLHPDVIFQGGANEDIRAACRDVRERAGSALRVFRQEAGTLPRSLRPAFAPLALVQPYLKRLAAPEHHPLRDLVQINPLARYGLIWRAYLSGRF
jgi:phytoene synthase